MVALAMAMQPGCSSDSNDADQATQEQEQAAVEQDTNKWEELKGDLTTLDAKFKTLEGQLSPALDATGLATLQGEYDSLETQRVTAEEKINGEGVPDALISQNQELSDKSADLKLRLVALQALAMNGTLEGKLGELEALLANLDGLTAEQVTAAAALLTQVIETHTALSNALESIPADVTSEAAEVDQARALSAESAESAVLHRFARLDARLGLVKARQSGTYDLDVIARQGPSLVDAWGCPRTVDCAYPPEVAPVKNPNARSAPKSPEKLAARRAGTIIRALFGVDSSVKRWSSIQAPMSRFGYWETDLYPDERPDDAPEGTPPTYLEILKDPKALHALYLACRGFLATGNLFGIRFDKPDGVALETGDDAVGTLTVKTREALLRFFFGQRLMELAEAYDSMIIQKGWERYEPILDHHESGGWDDDHQAAYAGVTPGFFHPGGDKTKTAADLCGGNLEQWSLHGEYEMGYGDVEGESMVVSEAQKWWVRQVFRAAQEGGVPVEYLGTYLLDAMRLVGITDPTVDKLHASLRKASVLQGPAGDDESKDWMQEAVGIAPAPAVVAPASAKK